MSEQSVLILACGALAREIKSLLRVNGLKNVEVEYLPASLHNRPERICGQIRARLERALSEFDRVLLGYADCGTGGEIDRLCSEFQIERLPGSHCYEFYLEAGRFDQLHEEEPGTFYLTDYLAKHFDRLIFKTLGIDEHPELFGLYFDNYRRVVHLTQENAAECHEAAAAAAGRLGLPLRTIFTGWGRLETSVFEAVHGKDERNSLPTVPVTISQ
ncbi:MAG: hypothetical protein CL456_10820 [Acidimicrobiaceae bacterium]|nr:hypothetical protein [Acidimicrobiaceae bacterium]|tara:strand:+ start:14292 stop:14936 length:645 start_codon:yes stop_codon:yes gene_type:complete